jgi:hypothetical protein
VLVSGKSVVLSNGKRRGRALMGLGVPACRRWGAPGHQTECTLQSQRLLHSTHSVVTATAGNTPRRQDQIDSTATTGHNSRTGHIPPSSTISASRPGLCSPSSLPEGVSGCSSSSPPSPPASNPYDMARTGWEPKNERREGMAVARDGEKVDFCKKAARFER